MAKNLALVDEIIFFCSTRQPNIPIYKVFNNLVNCHIPSLTPSQSNGWQKKLIRFLDTSSWNERSIKNWGSFFVIPYTYFSMAPPDGRVRRVHEALPSLMFPVYNAQPNFEGLNWRLFLLHVSCITFIEQWCSKLLTTY